MTPGGAASGQRGATYERELCDRFRAAGWGCIRLGASGAGGDADLPDVFAGRNLETDYGQAWSVELKSGKADILYVDADEVAALTRFADRFGATPYLGIRSTQQATPTATFLVRPADARRTDSGRYAVDVDGVADVASVVVGADGEVDVR